MAADKTNLPTYKEAIKHSCKETLRNDPNTDIYLLHVRTQIFCEGLLAASQRNVNCECTRFLIMTLPRTLTKKIFQDGCLGSGKTASPLYDNYVR